VSLPLLRQEWGTRLAHNVRRCSPAQRLALHAPRSAGYCLSPTADLSKSKRGPISTNGPYTFSMSPNRAICSDKSICFSPLAARALTIRSWSEALDAGDLSRAWMMASSCDACP